jgi:hypothetical protein
MNTPNVPSASLYRFKSVLGVIAMAISVFSGTYLLSNYSHKSNLLNTSVELVNQELENLISERERITKQIIPICELNNCKCVDERGVLIVPVFKKGPPLMHRKPKELKELYFQHEQTISKIHARKVSLDMKLKLLNEYTSQTNWFILISFIILVTGIVLVITGFRDWRNKIQKFQDAILEEHARKLNSNIQNIIPRRRRRLS